VQYIEKKEARPVPPGPAEGAMKPPDGTLKPLQFRPRLTLRPQKTAISNNF
jgi:hypothetical protein